MLTGKQRAQLRSLANPLETILQIGKAGISEETVVQVNDALKARELIKLRVLENSPLSAKEAAIELADKCHANVVQVIGFRFVLYRKNPQNPKIVI